MQHLTHGNLVDQMSPGIDLWLDGGHNPAAAKLLQQNLRNGNKNQTVLLL